MILVLPEVIPGPLQEPLRFLSPSGMQLKSCFLKQPFCLPHELKNLSGSHCDSSSLCFEAI